MCNSEFVWVMVPERQLVIGNRNKTRASQSPGVLQHEGASVYTSLACTTKLMEYDRNEIRELGQLGSLARDA